MFKIYISSSASRLTLHRTNQSQLLHVGDVAQTGQLACNSIYSGQRGPHYETSCNLTRAVS